MLRHIFYTLLLLIIAAGCAKEVAVPEEQAAPAPKPASSATLPATQVEASLSGKTPLGRLGLNSEAPAGMCWLDMAETSPDNSLVKVLAPSPADSSLQALALAVNCQQLQNWRASRDMLPVSYLILAQKMNERVGGGGGNQARERWMMVQSLGGNFGFFPQDQYARPGYLTSEAAKLPANGQRRLGEVRRDDMALYTLDLKRDNDSEPRLLLTLYSQLRGTPVALIWSKPLRQVEGLSPQIMNASAYLAGLVRQSDDPRLAAAPVPTPPPPAPAAPASLPAAAGGNAAALPPAAAQDITGWEKAAFGITPAQLREHYVLANPARENLHGKAFYLDGRNARMGGLDFKVLFDFSDSPMGPQRLGRIIFSGNTSGADNAKIKEALLADLNKRFGQPGSDASANGGPIVWDRASGKASLQMMTSASSAVWLVVLEAKNK